MKKLSYLIVAALLLSACAKEQLPQANYDIIPQPKEVSLNDEKPFELNSKILVYYESGLQREAQFLSGYVNDIMGFAMEIQEYQGQTDGIVLKLSPDDFDQAEAYEINITPKQVEVIGADASGVFFGIQTLRKSLPIRCTQSGDAPSPSERGAGGSKYYLPTATIRDWPNFAYRAMHLDPCEGLHRHAGHAQHEPVSFPPQ